MSLAYYMLSFDLIDCEPKDYEALKKYIHAKFPKSCKILSTTYLIRTNESEDAIADWLKSQMTDKNTIRLCVVKYVESQSWLSKSIQDCISKMRT